MSLRVRRSKLNGIALAALIVALSSGVQGQSGTKNGEWRTYGGDLGSTRYAPLDQINGLIHHGVWDYDIPCAPVLADITVSGRTIKALAQPTKQGM